MAKRDVTAPSAKLARPTEEYTPAALHDWDEKELRREYSRLRAIANKRLKRFVGSAYEDSPIYRRNKNRFVPLSDLGRRSQVEKRLADLALFIEAKTSTISGQRERKRKALQTLHEHGYDFILDDNFKDFYEWMEEVGASGIGAVYDSDTAVQYYRISKGNSRRLTILKFQKWVDEQQDIIRRRLPRGGGVSSEEMQRKLRVRERRFYG